MIILMGYHFSDHIHLVCLPQDRLLLDENCSYLASPPPSGHIPPR